MSDGRLASRHTIHLIAGDSILLGLLLTGVALFVSPESTATLVQLAAKVAPVIFILQISLYYAELYDDREKRSRTDLFLRLAPAFLGSMLALSLLYYLVPVLRLDPGVLLNFMPLAAAGVFVWHGFLHWAGGREALGSNVLILGTAHTAQQVAAELRRRAPLGYRVVGFLADHPAEVGKPIRGVPVLGVSSDIVALVRDLKVNLIVVAQDDRRGRLPVEDLLRCRVEGVLVEEAPAFFERLAGKVMVSNLRPSWLVFAPGFRAAPNPLMRLRRFVEAVLAAVLLVLVSPLLAVLWVLVRLEDPGPFLYRQARVGKDGKVFSLTKLRTMRTDAEAKSGPVWATSNDPRVTRVGRWLRKLRLDELPQLINVIRGEMSFVGPRPERPHYVEQLRRVIPYYDERHRVQPGITGWAQVKFSYGSTIEDSERKLQLDLFYIKNMSFFLDLVVVLDTVKVMLAGRGAR